jgi:nitrite reductase/ring-hydroxylating ferredoxin subunit
LNVVARSRGFPGLPNGWFAVARPSDVGVGKSIPIEAFGEDLVLFRTRSGRAVVLDAHCPHLGAHLGRGGQVEGETLACPFHQWRYGADGACVHVPYADKVPPRAKVRSWPTAETDAFIYVWHHRQGAAPTTQPPQVPQYRDRTWRRLPSEQFNAVYETHAQDVAENLADLAHFRTIHGAHRLYDVEHTRDGAAYEVRYKLDVTGSRGMPGFETLTSQSHTRFHGVATALTTMRFDGLIEVLIHASVLPLGPGPRCMARVDYLWRPVGPLGRAFGWFAARRLLKEAYDEGQKDIAIWTHKVYQAQPVLCANEKPLGVFRAWAEQFYEDGEAVEAG